MKETLRLGGVLLILAAVSGLVLAAVNAKTAPVIAEAELQATLESYREIYGDLADDFEPLDPAEEAALKEKYDVIDSIFVAKKGGEPVGYGINFIAKGFGGPLTSAVGFTNDDRMAGYRNIQNGETPGFGKKIEESYYYETFNDKDISSGLTGTSEGTGENEVMSISGATVTSKGVLAALNQVIDVYHEELGK